MAFIKKSVAQNFFWYLIATFVLTTMLLGLMLYREYYEARAENVVSSDSTNLVLQWRFNEGVGTATTADSSPSGFTGTMVNLELADWSTDTPASSLNDGFSLNFDDADPEYVMVTDPVGGQLDFNNVDFSLSGWFNRDSFATDDTILAKRNGQLSTDIGYLVYIDDATDTLIVEVSDGTNEYQIESTTSFTTTGWNAFTFVWDESSEANTLLYINGVAEGTKTGTHASVGDLSNALAFHAATESDNGEPFDGKLNDIRVYDNVLTSSAARFLSNGIAPGGVSTNIAAWYRADEGTNTTVDNATLTSWIDLTGNGNDLTDNDGTDPSYQSDSSNLANFNPTIDFDGNDFIRRIGTPTVYDNQGEYFTVANGSGHIVGIGISSIIANRLLGVFHSVANSGSYEVSDNSGAIGVGPMTQDVVGSDFNLWNPRQLGTSANNTYNGFTGTGAAENIVGGLNRFHIGARYTRVNDSESSFFNGLIPEVITFSEPLSDPDDRLKVNSYLGLKYGITLGDTASVVDYTASDGTTIFWAGDITYQNDVFGIGKDSFSGLEQQISGSINSDALITLSTDADFTGLNGTHAAITTDLSFLMMGNNNGTTALDQAITGPAAAPANSRMNRVWKIDRTGTIAGINLNTSSTDAEFIVVSADETFDSSDLWYSLSSGTVESTDTNAGGAVTFNTAMADGSFVTFASFEENPGGVTGSLIWIKANDGVGNTGDGTIATSWTNHGSLGNPTVIGTPVYNENLFNFNPTVTMSNGQELDFPDISDDFTAGLASYFAGNLGSVQTSERIFEFTNGTNILDNNIIWSRDAATDRTEYVVSPPGGPLVQAISNAGYLEDARNNVYGLRSDNAAATFYKNAVDETSTSTTAQPNIVTRVNNTVPGSNFLVSTGGEYTEVIIFNDDLSAAQNDRVHSYLALKYGATLAEGTAKDYTASDGSTIFWTGDATYQNDVFGIGRDDISDLEQQISKSQNSDALITLSTDTNFTGTNGTHAAIATDLSFLMLGNDDATTVFGSTFNGVASTRMNRIWKADVTGGAITPNIAIPNGTVFPAGDKFVVVSTDTTFDATDTRVELTDDGTNLHASATIPDGAFVTFASFIELPTITDANISIAGTSLGTGGAYIIGSEVTVTWDSISDGNTAGSITAASADLSGWGGGAAATMTDTTACGGTAADNIFEACFTLVSGAIDATNVNATVTASTAGGSTGPVSDSTNATVDNQAPSITDNGTLTITDDEAVNGVAAVNGGGVDADNVTQSTVTLAVSDGDTQTTNFTALTGQAAVTNGVQSADIITGALDGAAETFTITVTDNAGNTTTGLTDAISVDNQIPSITDNGTLTITDDEGVNGVAAVNGNGTDADNVTQSTVTLAVSDGDTETTDFTSLTGQASVANGVQSGDIISGSLDSGTQTFTITVTDNGGNVATAATDSISVDNQIPSITDNGTLTITDDEGVNGVAAVNGNGTDADNVTQSTVTLAVSDGDTETTDFTSLTGQASVANGVQSGDIISGSLDSGTQTFTITVTDNGGNVATATSDAISVDNILPSITDNGTLTITDDEGVNGVAAVNGGGVDADNVTQSTVTIAVSDGDTQVTDFTSLTGQASVANGVQSGDITSGALDSATQTFTIIVTDNGGNVATAATDSISVDNQIPSITDNGTLTITDDEGVNGVAAVNGNGTDADNVTQSTVTLAVSDGDTETTDFTSLTGQASVANGVQSGDIISGSLDSGTQTFTITVTDNGGNVATATSDAISVDNILPSITDNGTLTITDDEGVNGVAAVNGGGVDADNVTQSTVTIAVSDGDTQVTDFTSLTGQASVANGVQSGDITSGALDSATQTFTIIVTDNGGNVATAATDSISVDNQIPSITDNGTLTITDDEGVNGVAAVNGNGTDADNVTQSTVTLAVSDGDTETTDFTSLTGQASVANGVQSGDIISGSLDSGTQTFTITVTDNGGNVATATSDAISVDNEVNAPSVACITVTGATGTSGAFKNADTAVPTWNNDNPGAGCTDNFTDIASTLFDASSFRAGDTALIGSVAADVFTATLSGALDSQDDTNNNITVTATDDGGNVASTTGTNNFTIDTIVPVAAEVTAVTTPTNDQTPDYTFSSNEVGTIGYGGSCSSATTAAVSGNNTVTFNSLGAGTYNDCTIVVTDDAGNASNTVAVTEFEIDITSPAAPTITSPVAASSVEQNPTISGTGTEAGATVTVIDTSGPTTLCTALVGAGPGFAWTCVSGVTLPLGPATLAAFQTDQASNQGPNSATVGITVVESGGGGVGNILRQTPPSNPSIEINLTLVSVSALPAAGLCTPTPQVDLTLRAENAVLVKVSENPLLTGAGWQTFTSPASAIPFTLSSGDGEKIVYAQFRSSGGADSEIVSDSITLDEANDCGTIEEDPQTDTDDNQDDQSEDTNDTDDTTESDEPSLTDDLKGGPILTQEGGLYYINCELERHFFSDDVYNTWYLRPPSSLDVVGDNELSLIPIKAPATYRPGTMVKVESLPEVDLVTPNRTLRHIANEEMAERLFGPNWASQIRTIQVTDFNLYTRGEQINDLNTRLEDYIGTIDSQSPHREFTGQEPNCVEVIESGVTVYEHINFQGQSETFFTGDDDGDLRDNVIGQDIISSIRVFGNATVTFFKDILFGGIVEVFTDSDEDLRDNAIGNDTISSLQVEDSEGIVNTNNNLEEQNSTPQASSCTLNEPLTASMSQGSVGGEVIELQTLLKCLGYFPQDIEPTSFYGPVTTQAVQTFQAENGIPSLGIVGPSTRDALNEFVQS